MDTPESQARDDPSSAPESGTVCDETSGNKPAAPHERPTTLPPDHGRGDPLREGAAREDDPSVAGEER